MLCLLEPATGGKQVDETVAAHFECGPALHQLQHLKVARLQRSKTRASVPETSVASTAIAVKERDVARQRDGAAERQATACVAFVQQRLMVLRMRTLFRSAAT